MPEGTLGWQAALGTYHATAEAACEADWQHYQSSRSGSRYIGAFETDSPARRSCSWTSYQYLCPQETGGGIGECGTILPSSADLRCAYRYYPIGDGYCVPLQYSVPEICDPCDGVNFGGTALPLVGNPISLQNGTKLIVANDFSTEDGRFSFTRKYRSKVHGRVLPAFGPSLGLGGNWNYDFALELQLANFTGSPSNPNARLTVSSGDGSAQVFELNAQGQWIAIGGGLFYGGGYQRTTDLVVEYDGQLPASLSAITSGPSQWRFTDRHDAVWVLSSGVGPNPRIARPLSRTSVDGYRWDFAYNSDGSLASITDSFGRTAAFEWRKFYISSLSSVAPRAEAISSITLPDATQLRFTYDPPASGGLDPQTQQISPSDGQVLRLTKVERVQADGTVLDTTSYVHEDPVYPRHVTGSFDHLGQRTATYAYAPVGGFTTLTEGANGADRYTVEYSTSSAYTTTVTYLYAKVTNPLGKETTYRFRRSGPDYRLEQIAGAASANTPATTATSTFYNNVLSSWTDERGQRTNFTRDTKARPGTIVEAALSTDPRTTGSTYDTVLHSEPVTITHEGLTENRTFTSGQLTSVALQDTSGNASLLRSWAYEWSPEGNLLASDGPLPGTIDRVVMTYDASGQLATSTNELGHVTTVGSRDARGAPLSIMDPNGVITEMTYDALGRLLTVTVDPGTEQSLYAMEYDAVGNMTKLTLPMGGWLAYTYDAARRVTRVENDRGEVRDLTLNAMGDPTAETIADASLNLTASSSKTYDELGRLIQSVGGGGQTWSYTYDQVGNLLNTTDARGKQWTQQFDALERLEQATNPELATNGFDHDKLDELTGFTDGRGLQTNRVVDGFGNLLQEANPDSGLTTYSYNDAGWMTGMVDAAGRSITYSYDATGRLTAQQATSPISASQTISYTYDDTTGGNFGIGRLTQVTDPSGSTQFLYDAQGRVIADSRIILGQSYALQYGYDANGAVTSITYPSGHVVEFARASDGLVTGISARASAASAATPIASNIAWLPFGGPLKSLSYGNGLALTHSHDLNHWLTGISLTGVSGAVLDVTYARDANGNVSAVTDTAAAGRNASYSYTDANRLGSASGSWGSDSYTFDANGNRTLASRTTTQGSGSDVATIEATSNRLTEIRDPQGTLARSLGYDAAGELVTQVHADGRSFVYDYDARGRLAGISLNAAPIVSNAYDYLERRVSRTQTSGGISSTVHYIYGDDGLLLAEHDGSTGALLREYIWLEGSLIAIVEGTVAAPAYSYVHTGHLDEPVMVTDAAGQVISSITRDPWGNAILLTGSAELSLGYPGQWHDQEGGLYQNWHRDYDPTLGRYIETDPIGLPGGTNLYAYVDGNPVNAVDPRGLQSVYDIHIWDRSGLDSLGHVMITPSGSNKIILNSYPDPGVLTPFDPAQPQVTKTFEHVARKKGRADWVIKILVPNDAAFLEAAKDHRSRDFWDGFPQGKPNETNCTYGAWDSLMRGGVDLRDGSVFFGQDPWKPKTLATLIGRKLSRGIDGVYRNKKPILPTHLRDSGRMHD